MGKKPPGKPPPHGGKRGGGRSAKFTRNGTTYWARDYGYKCWPFIIKKRKSG
jgi:hypothetical protein